MMAEEKGHNEIAELLKSPVRQGNDSAPNGKISMITLYFTQDKYLNSSDYLKNILLLIYFKYL